MQRRATTYLTTYAADFSPATCSPALTLTCPVLRVRTPRPFMVPLAHSPSYTPPCNTGSAWGCRVYGSYHHCTHLPPMPRWPTRPRTRRPEMGDGFMGQGCDAPCKQYWTGARVCRLPRLAATQRADRNFCHYQRTTTRAPCSTRREWSVPTCLLVRDSIYSVPASHTLYYPVASHHRSP